MRWFKEKEFACKCCGELPLLQRKNVEALIKEVLDPIRENLGRPIIVNSGYRCAKHNSEVGGAKYSQHLVGEAADIRHTDGTDVTDIVQTIKANGKWDQLIIYPTFVHVSWKRFGPNRKQVLRKGGSL